MVIPFTLMATVTALCATPTPIPIKMPTIQEQCQALFITKGLHKDLKVEDYRKAPVNDIKFTVTDVYSDFTITPQTVNCWDVR